MPEYNWEQEYSAKRIRDNAHLIPHYMVQGLVDYVCSGYAPGDFMRLLLSNDLMGCMGRADEANQRAISGWCKMLYNYVPSGCYGSPERYNAWIEQNGLADKAAA